MTQVGEVTYVASIDTSKLAADARLVENTVSKTGDTIESTGRKSFSAFASNASNAFNGVASAIAGLAKVAAGLFLGGALGIGAFVKQASELQSVRASFESMTGSAEDATKVLQQLNKFSFKTAFSTADINAAARTFLGAGLAVKDLGKIMANVGDIAGATGADLGALTLPLSQALARGKLQTQDFYQILNSGAGKLGQALRQELAERGMGDFMKAMEEGKVTSDILFDVVAKSAQKGGFAFEGAIKQANTFNGRMSNLQETIGNVALKVLGVNKATGEVDPNGVFARMSKAVQDATDWLGKNEDGVKKVANAILDNAIPAISGLVAAFAVSKLAAIGFTVAAGVAAGTISLPFTIAAAAVAAVTAAIVFLQVKFNAFGGVIDFVSKAVKNISDAISILVTGDFKHGMFGFQEDSPFVVALITVHKVLKAIGKFISDVLIFAWNQLSEAFEKVNKALKPFLPQLKILGAIIGVAVLAPLLLLVAAITTVIVVISLLAAAIAFVINKLVDFGKWVADVVGGVIKWFQEAGANVGQFFTDVGNSISDFIQSIVDFFKPITDAISGVFTTILQIVTGIFIAIVAIIAIAAQWVYQNFVQPVINFFTDMFKTIIDAVGTFVQGVIAFFTPIVGWIYDNIIKPIGNFFAGLWKGITDGVSNAVTTVQSVFNTVIGWIKRYIIDPIAGFFNGLWKGITDGINGAVQGIKTIFNTMVGIIKTPINAIIDAINGVIAGINKLKVPDWVPGLGGSSPNIPRIPKLAEGGIVTSPTLAMIGEGRESEAVIPLSKLEEMIKVTGDKPPITQNVYPQTPLDLKAASMELAYQISKG